MISVTDNNREETENNNIDSAGIGMFGMKLLLVERHASPTVAAGWVAHVGSVNETTGITGIAHLFEHMMFKGTTTIGTRDHQREARFVREPSQQARGGEHCDSFSAAQDSFSTQNPMVPKLVS